MQAAVLWETEQQIAKERAEMRREIEQLQGMRQRERENLEEIIQAERGRTQAQIEGLIGRARACEAALRQAEVEHLKALKAAELEVMRVQDNNQEACRRLKVQEGVLATLDRDRGDALSESHLHRVEAQRAWEVNRIDSQLLQTALAATNHAVAPSVVQDRLISQFGGIQEPSSYTHTKFPSMPDLCTPAIVLPHLSRPPSPLVKDSSISHSAQRYDTTLPYRRAAETEIDDMAKAKIDVAMQQLHGPSPTVQVLGKARRSEEVLCDQHVKGIHPRSATVR